MPDFEMEPVRPSPSEVGARMLWYPLAEAITPLMKTRGKYANNYPRGAVVHHTAGRDRNEDDAKATVSWGRAEGYCFFTIGPSGGVYQAFPLDEWGYHAGDSAWTGLGSGVSTQLVGIEVCGAGLLDKDRKSWFGQQYQPEDVRSVKEADYGCPTGIYKSFTEEQEQSLIQLLKWLYSNNPTVFNPKYILGHHEVSGKKGIGYFRKNDPGGSLSMTMDELRKKIK